ncbi:MAG: hypothetical protein LQ342_005624 [Letrouitia transgressa]|nr:MAG: hypothetical protein LQ342_005624 [Letrouitia transgressa]
MDLGLTQKIQLDHAPARQKSSESQGCISLAQTQRDDEPNDAAAYMDEETKGFISQFTRRRSVHGYNILGIWWVEAAACTLSMVALFAFVATPYPHQNRPLPQWPYNISVNSLISIYVIILKAMVLFVITEGMSQLKWRRLSHNRPLTDLARYDEASRGPLGSLRLLSKLRLQHPLSSIGAFVTVFAVVTCPTTQQIIRYYDCNVFVRNSTASIPRTNCYFDQGWHIVAGLKTIEPPLQAAVSAGIFSPGQSVTPKCDSGNCTFPTAYHTLGYCSSCTDISDQVRVNESRSNDTYSQTLFLSCHRTFSVLIDTKFNPKNITLVLSNRCELDTDFLGQPEAITMAVTQEDAPSNIIFVKGPVANRRCANENTTDHWSCRGYGAASCTMRFCVRTYNATISTGVFQEDMIDHTNFYGPGSFDGEGWMSMIDTRCISPQETEKFRSEGYQIPTDLKWLPYNMTFDPRVKPSSGASFPQSMVERQCIYSIDYILDRSLWWTYLRSFFNGTVTAWRSFENDADVVDYRGPQNLQAIYNFGNVTFNDINQTFQNISNSVTNYLRQGGNLYHGEPAIGQEWHNRTCIEVRWAWLAFPTVAVFLTLLFFVATVIYTRPTGNRPQIWKSSPLALLYHGLEQQPDVPGVERLAEMEHAAKGTLVRLKSTQTGVKLVVEKSEKLAG